MLRRQFKDPRIHFAINCASNSCPIIANRLYTEENIEQSLNFMTRNFVNNPQQVHISSDGKKLHLNKIFKWFKRDFQIKGGILSFIRSYHDKLKDSVQIYKIKFSKYDWAVNVSK